MKFFSKENPDRWYFLAWWLCVITLPFLDMGNNVCLILLTLIWLADGGPVKKWHRLKAAKWGWPFFLYYFLLIIGLIYTRDFDNGIFTLDKKITFFVLPLIAITGRHLDQEFISFLKRSFVYSCAAIVLICLSGAAINFLVSGSTYNFDTDTQNNFNSTDPSAPNFWMNFSYVQLASRAGLHPTYFSMYLVFCLTLLFTEQITSSRQRWINISIGILIGGFIALLSSRMAIFALVFSSSYLLMKKIKEQKYAVAIPVLIIIAIVGLILWVNPLARYRMFQEPIQTKYLADKTVTNWNSVNYRLLEWEGSWSIIKTNLLFGIGTGGWQKAMTDFYKNYNESTVGLEHNSHNQFLQTWMENGAIGLIAFVLCVFVSVFRQQTDPSYAAFILIFSMMCLTESIGERQKGVVFFTMFQTLYLAFKTKHE